MSYHNCYFLLFDTVLNYSGQIFPQGHIVVVHGHNSKYRTGQGQQASQTLLQFNTNFKTYIKLQTSKLLIHDILNFM